jgi:tRNA (guanine37-N1)-methyltransferase
MRIDVVTIFPDMFREVFDFGIVRRAREKGLVAVQVHDLRSWTHDRHRTTDDAPYGGGPGMVMKVEPLVEAVEAIAGMGESGAQRLVLLSPRGIPIDQPKVQELSEEEHLVLVAGRYEGVDERVVEGLGAEEISIGDSVLSGGEVPALVVLEAVTRLVPGVIGRDESHERDSFGQDGLLDHPHYTRPPEFRGMAVPEVLLSGDHAAIERWRREAAREKTRRNRPDLLEE